MDSLARLHTRLSANDIQGLTKTRAAADFLSAAALLCKCISELGVSGCAREGQDISYVCYARQVHYHALEAHSEA